MRAIINLKKCSFLVKNSKLQFVEARHHAAILLKKKYLLQKIFANEKLISELENLYFNSDKSKFLFFLELQRSFVNGTVLTE